MQALRTSDGGLVTLGGTPLRHSGYVDHFDHEDGPLGGPWEDAYDIYGSDLFDQAMIVGGQLELVPRSGELVKLVSRNRMPLAPGLLSPLRSTPYRAKRCSTRSSGWQASTGIPSGVDCSAVHR